MNSAVIVITFCALFIAVSFLKLSPIRPFVQANFMQSLTHIIANKLVFLSLFESSTLISNPIADPYFVGFWPPSDTKLIRHISRIG